MDLSAYVEIQRGYGAMRAQISPSVRVSFDEFASLCLLYGGKTFSPSEMSHALGVTCPTITYRGSRLEKLGFLTRVPCSIDHRSTRCALTRRGSLNVTRALHALQKTVGEQAGIADATPSTIAAMIAKMGSLPLGAHDLILLCFKDAEEYALSVGTLVKATGQPQPTVSMAVRRLVRDGYLVRATGSSDKAPIEEYWEAARIAGDLHNHTASCVPTEAGMKHAEELAAMVEAL